jgi:histone acetyltransferase (RNA polymerase elongator complex component)
MASVLVIPVFIPHRGCPHRCIFCNQNVITAAGQTLPGPEDMARIIREYLRYKGNRRRVELAFFGGNFLGLPEREMLGLLRAVGPWLDRGEIQAIRCSTRPDTVTPERLDMVRPLGMALVELGVQSMDDGVLALSRRGHTRAHTLDAVAALKAAGMKVGVQLMTGLPGDTPEKSAETAKQAASLGPDLARIYPALVLEGALLADAFRRGAYRPQTLDESVARVRDMACILEAAGIPVVRMGLQAGEGLAAGGTILAGPWHPAFGHLVRAAQMLDQARAGLERALEKGTADRVVLEIHPRSESRLRGDKNSNLDILVREYPGIDFQIRTNPELSLEEVAVKQGKRT